MARIPLCLLSLLWVVNTEGQSIFPSEDAIYPTLEDLILHRPDTNCHLRKIDDVRVDSLVKRCWFADRDNGMIKDAIAVAFQGQLYFQDQVVRQKLPGTFHPHARKESNCFYPILEQGRYYYFEMLSEDKNPDLAIAMGLMTGGIGSAFGNTLTLPEMVKSSIVFDPNTKAFFGMDTWKDVQLFIEKHYPDYHSTTRTEQLNHADIRQMVAKWNSN